MLTMKKILATFQFQPGEARDELEENEELLFVANSLISVKQVWVHFVRVFLSASSIKWYFLTATCYNRRHPSKSFNFLNFVLFSLLWFPNLLCVAKHTKN